LLVVPEARLVAAADVEDDLDDLDAEDEEPADWDDLDDEPAPLKTDFSLAESVDAEMSEVERRLRMTVCLGLARQKFQRSPEEMQEGVKRIAEAREMSAEQASELISISMIKNCYINFNAETDLGVLSEQNESAWDEAMTRLISPPKGEIPGTSSQLLERQWDLLRQIVEEQDERVKEVAGRIELPGSTMGGFQKFAYFVSVFGAIFGGGYFLVKKLMEAEREPKKKTKDDKKKSDEKKKPEEKKKD
jgi:hypothetical protein